MATRYTAKGRSGDALSSVIGQDEKLKLHAEVLKIGKASKGGRSKKYHIVVTHLLGSQNNYTLYIIHQNKSEFRIKHKFSLIESFAVDFLSKDSSRNDFVFYINDNKKALHFECSNWAKKKSFLVDLYKLCKILPKESMPTYKNVDYGMLEETVNLSDTLQGMQEIVNMSEAIAHEYKSKYLTTAEEEDLEKVCANCNWESAEEFISGQSKELSGLDNANIHSIISVEDEITQLFVTMDDAIRKLKQLEQNLDHYSTMLNLKEALVRDIYNQNTTSSLRVQNNLALVDKTQELVKLLSLPYNLADLSSVRDPQFSSAVLHIQDRVTAIRAHELAEMRCAQDTLAHCEVFLSGAVKMLNDELNGMFRQDWQGKHKARHINVDRYANLLDWCKGFDSNVYNAILQAYVETTKKGYRTEIANYFKEKSNLIQKRSNLDKGFSFGAKPSTKPIASTMDLSASKNSLSSFRRDSLGSLDSIATRGSGESGYLQQAEHNSKFDQILMKHMDFIKSLLVNEEEHLNRVWGFPVIAEHTPEMEDAEWAKVKEQNGRTERRLSEILGGKLEEEFMQFLETSNKIDSYYALFMYLRLIKASHAHDTSYYLRKFYGGCMVRAKKNFDEFIRAQVTQIREVRVNKSKSCGILRPVHKFDQFVQEAENLFNNEERRVELEKGYVALLEALFQTVDRAAKEQQKVPGEVVMFENYHHIARRLSWMELATLAEHLRTCNKTYKENLEGYISGKLGDPIEKISTFFAGVKSCLTPAMRPEEVGFNMNYSKSNLNKLLEEYQFKVVKKSIDNSIAKIDKHLSKEESLFSEVRGRYLTTFFSHITEYSRLMDICYPGSKLQFRCKVEELRTIYGVEEEDEEDVGQRLAAAGARWDESTLL